MTTSKENHPKKSTDKNIVLFSILYSMIMLLAHWHFFATLHGSGGIIRGLNAMFQLVGNLIAVFSAIVILISLVFKKVSPVVGFISAMFLGTIGFYCLGQAFAMMVSV